MVVLSQHQSDPQTNRPARSSLVSSGHYICVLNINITHNLGARGYTTEAAKETGEYNENTTSSSGTHCD